MASTKRIIGQVIYAGPTIPQLGLHYGNIFRNGIFPQFYNFIAACPSIGALFIPVKQFAAVRRELNFDIARNMRGTTGKYPELYRAVQKWLADAAKEDQKPQPKGVKVKHHA